MYKKRKFFCSKGNVEATVLYIDNKSLSNREYKKSGIDCKYNCSFEECDVYKAALPSFKYEENY